VVIARTHNNIQEQITVLATGNDFKIAKLVYLGTDTVYYTVRTTVPVLDLIGVVSVLSNVYPNLLKFKKQHFSSLYFSMLHIYCCNGS
jgi:hypothetical protein